MASMAEIDKTLSTYIKHQTYPLAVKMLSREDEIPDDAKDPLQAFGVPFTLCQAFGLCRREDVTVVLNRDSQSCPIALAGLGFVRPDEYLSGKHLLAPINQSTEARKKIAETMPRFEFGRYTHILISPILKASFDPDVILFYGNSAQVMRMVQAAVFASGGAITSRSAGSGGCLLPVVASIQENECKYVLPGNGERRLGLVADDEMAFAMPRGKFEEVVEGLRLSHEGKQTYPVSPGYLKLEYKLPPTYDGLVKASKESSE
jgi:uncharacterized protein (DUF169 family)